MESTLFKIMIPHGEQLENLLLLLVDNNCLATSSHASALNLPTNDDLSKFLDCVTEDTEKSSLVNEMCVVVWMEEEVQWYFEFVCKDIAWLFTSFEFRNGSRISGEKLVILEFKYLKNKKW